MTDRYTNEEWAKQIAETQRKVLNEVQERGKEGGRGWKYEVPKTAGADFAKTVDHTVLKLDTKEGQIDALCSEARIEGFKVCHTSLFSLSIDLKKAVSGQYNTYWARPGRGESTRY